MGDTPTANIRQLLDEASKKLNRAYEDLGALISVVQPHAGPTRAAGILMLGQNLQEIGAKLERFGNELMFMHIDKSRGASAKSAGTRRARKRSP